MKRKKYTLEKILVTGYAAEGKSVARQDGKVIFIEGAVPGDVVDVFVSTNKKDYGEGKAIFIHEYSKERTTPFCKHFGVCGGCKWQMLPYEKQLEYKQQEVAQNFRRIGKVALPEMMPILGSEDTRYYRNKLEFTFSNKEYTVERPKKAPLPHEGGFLEPAKTDSFSEFGDSSFTSGGVQSDGSKTNELKNNDRSISTDHAANNFQHQNAQIAASKHIEEGTIANSTILENFSGTAENKNPPSGGRGALGYHVPRLFDKIIDIEECFLMEDVNNNIRNGIRSFALQNGYSFYDIKNHTGWLRNIILRNCTTGELMINICLGYEDAIETKRLMDFILLQVPSVTTLLYTINTKWNDTIYDLTPVVYYGKGFVEEKLGEFSFRIGPKSFFQTNSRQAANLYTITKNFAGLTGNEVVYDLYCGTGSIGIFISKLAKKIIGVEVIAEAIEDAKLNAAINQISHAEFFTGDVIKICDDAFFAAHGRPDVIITDPPRAGMHEKLVNKLLEIAAPAIVYVSCNTATQARDIGLLSAKYKIEKIQPVDMFPHTHHIECVVLLKLHEIA